MAKFLIEVPHEAKKIECARTIQIFLKTGSHFLTNAEWGWIIVELENKEEARNILPPAYRSNAKIVTLSKFTMEEIDEIIRHHNE
jgi:hypothetical protein